MNSFILTSSLMATPVQKAPKGDQNKSAGVGDSSSEKIKASSIPLYPEPEKWDYVVDPPSAMESWVKEARTQACKIKAECQPFLDQASNIINTGRAHTNETLITLRSEENLVGRVGAMAAGGLLGLIAGRRGGFFKKLTYFSVGLGTAGSICYPKEAKVLANDAGKYAMKNACIAYHFVVGSRPNVQNENGKAFEKMATMASDVTQWGFRLFEKKEDASVKPAEEQPNPTESEKEVKSPPQQPGETKKEEAPAPPPQQLEEIKKEEPEAPSQQEAPPQPAEVAKQEGEVPQPPAPVEEAPAQSYPDLEPPLPPTLSITSDTSVLEETPVPEAPKAAADDSKEKESNDKPLIIEGDLGQGSPEDKELYTTRE